MLVDEAGLTPLEALRAATTSIAGVVLHGRYLDRSELDAVIARAAE